MQQHAKLCVTVYNVQWRRFLIPAVADSVDSLIGKLGGCGRFQVLFVSLAYFPLVPATWSLLFMIFGNYNPGLECGDDYPSSILNTMQSSNLENDNFLHNTTVVCSCVTIKSHKNWTFNKAALTVVTEWSLICEDSWKRSTIISVQMVGVLLGSLVGGQIGDRFGRKSNIHGGAALLTVTNIIGVFSVSWVMYATVRFFIGFAVGAILSTVTIYNMEFLPSFWRGFIGTFPFWTICTFTLGLCVMALKNWKHVHIATAFVAMLAFLSVFWLPESMRFLAVHGHLTQANKVVKKIARLNKKPLPDTSIVTRIAEVEKESLKERSSYTYLHLFHKNIRKYTIIVGTTWFIISLSSNTIGFGLNAFSGDFFVNLLVLFVLPFPARLLGLLITSKVGRKIAMLTNICLSFACSFLIVGIQLAAPENWRGLATTALALVANIFIEASWGVAVVFIGELFPTGVRNMAYAFCGAVSRVGAMLGPYLILKESMPMWSVFLLIGLLLLICFLAVLTLPESKGKPLHDNLEVKVTKGQDSDVNSHV
ncbi:unnamed protein product [Candidula unifasciata]|uniref:Major facilitator superfamily (MFS) profile domain-containing protein n=1 Tax=Candidula unifasciata TaxID=100452 RepID=A0A8S3YSG4_9EUPU|nr:unnamed protein product [Candidula unifasciata]